MKMEAEEVFQKIQKEHDCKNEEHEKSLQDTNSSLEKTILELS